MNRDIDVRAVLPAIRSPTLILHRKGDLLVDVRQARYMAERIDGATLVELDGADHLPYYEGRDALVDEIELFLTGELQPPDADRVLASVLFTDIVGSTALAGTLGDERWRDLLARHEGVTRAAVLRHRGRTIKSTGDGFVAIFDGPARAVRCALAVCDGVRDLGIDVRTGVHTGEIELIGDDIGGIAVHIGQRVSSLAASGEVLVSRTVKDLVAGSGLEFDDRGTHTLRGIPDEWTIFAAHQGTGGALAPPVAHGTPPSR